MISAANEAGDRNNPTNAVQIRLRASLIGQKDCVILPQLSARLGLRQGHGGNLPLGYEMKDGKIAIVEKEAELVRSIFQRYLELGSVNELVRDLREHNIRTKTRQLSTGATRGGIPFGPGALYYLLSNHLYIGEVKYKNEILPGEQPPIMDRALFQAVRPEALAQWSHRTIV